MLPPPSPLRTGRDTFASSGSSLSSVPFETWHRNGTSVTRTSGSGGVARLSPGPISLPAPPSRYAPGANVHCCRKPHQHCCRHLLCLLCRFAKLSRDERPVEVCPLSREVMLQPLSALLPNGLRFFHILYPHSHWHALRFAYPYGRNMGLPCSAWMTRRLRTPSIRR